MPQPKVELTGPSGYKAEVTSGNRLKVEAELSVIGDVNIGNVDVLSIIPGVGATNLGKAEDEPHTTGDVGVQVLGVRDDGLSIITPPVGSDGDYVSFRMNKAGALWIEPIVVVGSTVKRLGHAEDTAHTTGDGGIMALSVRSNSAASTSGADGEYQPLITDTNGRLHVIDVSTAAALDGNELQVDIVSSATLSVNSHAVTNAGTFEVQVSDTSFAVADGNALGEGVLIQGDDGGDRKNVNVDATTGDVQVDVTHTVTVDCDSSNVTVDNAIDAAVYTRITDGTEVANITPNNELEVHIESIDASVLFTTRNLISSQATNGKVTVADSSTEIAAASGTRVSYTIVNDSDETIYISIEDAAVLNEGIRLNANGGSYSDTFSTDAIYGICASGSKNVTISQQFV